MKITVVGIGYDAEDLTIAGANAIAAADTVVVKSLKHSLPKIEGKDIISLDYVYESAADFEALDQSLASELERRAVGNTVFLVPGDGITDGVIPYIKDYRLIKGVSQTPSCACSAYTVISATELATRDRPNIDTDIPLVITEIDNDFLAADVKLKLLEYYAPETKMNFFGKVIALVDLDKQKRFGYRCFATVFPVPLLQKQRFNLNDLLKIMDRLMAPDGCPWDAAQTHESIRKNMIEEAYEAADAIDKGDVDNMVEEFGDVLLQSIFHSVIAERAGEFSHVDVLTALCQKLISRHTHVFGENRAANATEALGAWEAAKRVEKGVSVSQSCFDVARALPALMRASDVQKKVKKGGMDFASREDALTSLRSEIEELETAATDKREDELGDILFSACNVARFYGLDAETALNLAVDKFCSRIKRVEDYAIEKGKAMSDLSPAELDILWQAAKA